MPPTAQHAPERLSTANGAPEQLHASCDEGVVRAFELLGKRWNGVILRVLRDGPLKFSELRRAVGSITDSVLTDRLAELVERGVVARTETDARPPLITYQLTPSGIRLQPIIDELATWALQNDVDRVPAP
ncbi:helix-turn-helix transcriptional regulator [Planctomonas sp. JC2975]|uniref:winged helix-turn-helix transcriptional regulator n=1 Tax=Planctomonas sp. JC2975 TaxID=2729626 RepID=UPI001472E16C|nr:helix-turn-helix domain-containing protein [Planctomonas sp. JC2975]NNC12823.1 helix-turn-helix transcriptional regulator [Planctomonas sp. JC2975]